MNKVRISNDSLNCYSSRVMTEGLDISQYQRNPVVLYMHRRGEVIGYMKNVTKNQSEVTGELVFDEASELSQRCKKQWQAGSLKAVSAGIEILEVSSEASLLLPGQQNPSVVKSRLMEVSVVDIGGNDDALRLTHNGEPLLPLMGGKEATQAIFTNILNINKRKDMTQEKIAMLLRLDSQATEQQIEAKAGSLMALAKEKETLEQQVKQLKEEADRQNLALIEQAVGKAVKEGRIQETDRQEFVTMGQQLGIKRMEQLFERMQPAVKLSAMLNQTHEQPTAAPAAATWQKLSDVPADQLMALKEKDEKEYRRLFRAEYGFDY